jgi:hypothetical protein
LPPRQTGPLNFDFELLIESRVTVVRSEKLVAEAGDSCGI